jgi:hypothetical protein
MSDMRISFSNSDISIDGEFDINQSSDMKVVSKISLNASQTASIVHQIAASASMVHSVVQSAVSENAGVVPSNKTVNNAVACSDVNNFTKQINNVISNVRISVNANKSISFSGVKMAIKGNFKLTQNAIFDLTAEAIVTAAMSNVMNTSAAVISVLSSSTNQKTEATNPATVGVSGWLKTLSTVIIPIVALVVILGVITLLIKMKGSSTTQPQVQSQIQSVLPPRMQSVIQSMPSKIQSVIPSPSKIQSVSLPSAKTIGLPSAKTIGLPSAKTIGLPSAKTIGLPSAKTMGLPKNATGWFQKIKNAIPNVVAKAKNAATKLKSLK